MQSFTYIIWGDYDEEEKNCYRMLNTQFENSGLQ